MECFIIRSPSLVSYLNHSLTVQGSKLPLFYDISPKRMVSKTHLDDSSHEQTIICRQLFAGHVVGSRPMKSKGKMYPMIITIIFINYSKCKIPQCQQG